MAEAVGAGTIDSETISPSIVCPSASVTVCSYGLPAASVRRTVTRRAVGPVICGAAALEANVMMFLGRFARYEISSTLRDDCFQTFTV
jgi:hypothetical protein